MNADKKVSKKQATQQLEILPPTTWYKTENGEIFQVGEAYSHKNGRPTFATYQRINKQWFYRGEEHKHKNKDNIMESMAYRHA